MTNIKKRDFDFWMNDKQKGPIEFLLAQSVGFPVQIYWVDGKYQIMIHSHIEYNPRNAHEQFANEFWNWHMVKSPKFFYETPLIAAEEFVKQWRYYLSDEAAQAYGQKVQAKIQANKNRIRDRIKLLREQELFDEIRQLLGEDDLDGN